MKEILIILICSLIFLTACSNQQPQQRPLYTGSDGVTVTFPRENARTLYSEDIFTVSIRLGNDGASDVKKGWLTAVYDPAVFLFEEAKSSTDIVPTKENPKLPLSFTVRGRSRDVAVGEIDFADFTFKTLDVQGNRDKVTSSITFQACYPYTTTFIVNACIDRDIYNTEVTKVCLGTDLVGSNQGAPIAVSRVEPSFLFNDGKVKPRFKITLTNLQNGYTLWNEDSEKDGGQALCNQQTFERGDFGKLKVTASINNVPLDCDIGSNKDGITRFDTNTAEILCTYHSVDPGANYESPIVIQAQYFYVSSLTANIEVTNA